MNILIPDSWLREYLDTKATPEEIQKYLSLCGPSVERINDVNGEPVYDIEVTTNRVDCMSVQGIAREAAVILPEFGLEAKLKESKVKLSAESLTLDEPQIRLEIINDPKLCNRIMAVIMEVKTGSSPDWMQKRLEAVGIRSLNNLIDITNYVMMETGHPTHVFDWDRLNTAKLLIRESKKGEQVTTLDNKTYTLPGGDLIAEDDQGRIVDLLGIMGLENSVVTDQTKRILFFIDNNDSVKMRKTSMTLSIRTEAVTRNEKNIDPELASSAMYRGIELYQQLASGTLVSEIHDVYPNHPTLQTTSLSLAKVQEYLGVELETQRVQKILEALGCKVELEISNSKLEILKITPPTWRAQDLQIPQDYIEEIARIYGYHNLPSVLMPTPIPDNPPAEHFALEHQVKVWLADWGLQEVYTYSLVSEELAKQSGFSLEEHLKLKNPLSSDWQYLRRSMIPSHLAIFSGQPAEQDIKLFEMASVYHHSPNDLPQEEVHLTVTSGWMSFLQMRSLLDYLLVRLHITNLQVTPLVEAPGFLPQKVAQLSIDGQIVGLLGQVGWYGSWPISCLDLLIKPVLQLAKSHSEYRPVAPYPPIIEDFTFVFPKETYLGPVVDKIKSLDPLIAAANLKDTFQDSHTFRIHFQSRDKNLTTEDVMPVRNKLIKTVEDQFQAKLKG